MKTKLETANGIKIDSPNTFYEYYNSSLDIMYYGNDNLYPQTLKTFFRNSPTLNKCVSREADFLKGKSSSESGLISRQDFNSICMDYALFNGFSIYVHYDSEGVIDFLQHIPFESIRLKEKGQNGIFTRCSYCPDWSFSSTINKRKVTKKDITTYYLFSDNQEVRKSRASEDGGSEIFYFSEGTVYPISDSEPVLTYISTEIGLMNISYRNVRNSFMPSCVISIPRVNDDAAEAFSRELKNLQGDNNACKILTFEYSQPEEKPEMISLQTQNYDSSFNNTKDDCSSKIIGAFRQEAFLRLEDGSLGFGSDAISQIYQFYNFSLRAKRFNLVESMKMLDETFNYEEIKYEI